MIIKIAKRTIGETQPVFIVAELSCNHLQKYDLAVKTIKAIKKAGADAIKLQTFTPDSLSLNIKNKYFQKKKEGLWKGMTSYEIFQKAYTSWEWQPKLKKIAEKLDLICFSTPFDKKAVDFLEKINIPAYKIGSLEITDIPLIEYTASKQKPMLISTGIATKADIKEAIKACKRVGNNKIILLKCVSNYPTPLEEVNLKTIPRMKKTFKVIVGLSDHTLANTTTIAAVALGAKVIEKHFILKRSLKSLDAVFSLEADEFRQMVNSVREVEKALGNETITLTAGMKKARRSAKSLFVVKNIKKGEIFTEDNVRPIRPNNGLPPKYLKNILGKKGKANIKKGTPLSWKQVE
jgi:pseudaminic acid synthase